MEDKEVKVITLENNKEYFVVDKLLINNINYVFLSNENDPNDFCIRKEINDNLVGLDNEKEFELAILEFTKKYKDFVNKAE